MAIAPTLGQNGSSAGWNVTFDPVSGNLMAGGRVVSLSESELAALRAWVTSTAGLDSVGFDTASGTIKSEGISVTLSQIENAAVRALLADAITRTEADAAYADKATEDLAALAESTAVQAKTAVESLAAKAVTAEVNPVTGVIENKTGGITTYQFAADPIPTKTNPLQQAVGAYHYSESAAPSSQRGGVGALTAEYVQPASQASGAVGLYAGAMGQNSNVDLWAANFLIRALTGASGVYQCLEIDVDSWSAGATTKGIGLNGAGTENADVGIEITRDNTTRWETAIHILNSLTGIKIEKSGTNIGIQVGDGPLVSNTAVTVGQFQNGGDTVLVSRNTDTSPSGYLLRFVNAANNQILLSIDVGGNIVCGGLTTSGQVKIQNLVNAANDAAAASAGVPVNGVYRNGSVLMVRVA